MNSYGLRAETILKLPIRQERWNEVCTITPEQARMILEQQPAQRPVTETHVAALIHEMKSGRFVRTNEAMAFDENGLLFDGQHRCWACFESGFPIEVLCCFNEPRSNFDRIGTVVRRRTPSDYLMMSGQVDNATLGNIVAASGRFLWAYDTGINPAINGGARGWENGELMAVLERHPGVKKLANDMRAGCWSFPRSSFIALATLMHEAHTEKAATFIHQAVTGEGIYAGDPAFTLRASVKAGQFLKRGARVEISYRIARAWNAFYEGRQAFKLYGSNAAGGKQGNRKDGLDPFPRIAGLAGPKRAAPSFRLPKTVPQAGPQLGLSQDVPVQAMSHAEIARVLTRVNDAHPHRGTAVGQDAT